MCGGVGAALCQASQSWPSPCKEWLAKIPARQQGPLWSPGRLLSPIAVQVGRQPRLRPQSGLPERLRAGQAAGPVAGARSHQDQHRCEGPQLGHIFSGPWLCGLFVDKVPAGLWVSEAGMGDHRCADCRP